MFENENVEQNIENTKLNKIENLALDILLLSRNMLLVKLRFMDVALCGLDLRSENITFATEGTHLFYGAKHVINSYKNEKEALVRDYLHVVMHCVFRHPFVKNLIDQNCWDLACDIAVENMISELHIKDLESSRTKAQAEIIADLKQNLNMLTAEKLYRYFLDSNLSETQLLEIRAIFYADDHTPWYNQKKDEFGNCVIKFKSSENFSDSADSDNNDSDENNSDNDSNKKDSNNNFKTVTLQKNNNHNNGETENRWIEISERVKTDVEVFSKIQGNKAGSLTQNLMEVTRERYDYTAFLKKFATLGEVMKVNDDEFDYNFYTYGLQLYKNVPLIEPLEYKEVRRIKEFVIAIDTSGSVSGELVQKFLNKTYNILHSAESFFTKINLHIIQCDTRIQKDVKITSQNEFDEYIKNMKLHGFGGTDFRPVFEYTDKMILDKEFINLKGLIYFTDGYGTFPAKKPEYDTAFVFINDYYEIPQVPVWAIKLVLKSDEI